MIRYIIYAVASLLFDLLVWVTSPIWALWAAAAKRAALPYPFSLVHTHDDDIYGSKTTREPVPGSFFGRFKRAVWWLCRNPGYGFDAWVIGVNETDVKEQIIDGDDKREGVYNTLLLKNGGERWGYRRDLFYREDGERYCKLSLGWNHVAQSGFHKLKITINPFKKEE